MVDSLAQAICGMAYNEEPCGNESDVIVIVECTNPLCLLRDEVGLCKGCLLVVQQRKPQKCTKCGYGMIVTSPPRPRDAAKLAETEREMNEKLDKARAEASAAGLPPLDNP